MSWEEEKQRLGRNIMRELYDRGLVKTWYRDRPQGWELVSGKWSPLYIQLRPLCSYPSLLKAVGGALSSLVAREIPDTTRLIGIAMAGIPIALAVSLSSGLACAYTRKLDGVRTLGDLTAILESYGEHRLLEGDVATGDHLVFVDDLVTGLDSKLVAIEQVRHQLQADGVEQVGTQDVLVLLDREQGAMARAAEAGVRLHSLIPFRSKGVDWLKGDLADVEYRVITQYLEDPESFQDADTRERLMHEAR